MSMNHHEQSTTHHEQPPASGRSGMGLPLKIALLLIVLAAGNYLVREHWSHLADNWIYLLILACPLMHLFHGHGGHGSQSIKPDDKRE